MRKKAAMSLEDELANLNEETASLRQVAGSLWNYRQQLVQVGFSQAEAFDLVRDWQVSLTGVSEDED